ncbi:MAG TPA: YHS domain-containing protein [Pirellulales bacterium]|nr:YHS domain-containing protein [Pirellulales bacterium]
MKRCLTAITAFAALLTVSVYAADVKLDGVKCPVSGKAVKDDKTVDYKGAKVYFCCENCPKAFDKDKTKYATKANMQLVQTKQAKQEKCPIAGKDLNKDTATKVGDVEVSFCCNNCKGKVTKATDEEKLDLVFGEKAFEKGFKVTEKKK